MDQITVKILLKLHCLISRSLFLSNWRFGAYITFRAESCIRSVFFVLFLFANAIQKFALLSSRCHHNFGLCGSLLNGPYWVQTLPALRFILLLFVRQKLCRSVKIAWGSALFSRTIIGLAREIEYFLVHINIFHLGWIIKVIYAVWWGHGIMALLSLLN